MTPTTMAAPPQDRSSVWLNCYRIINATASNIPDSPTTLLCEGPPRALFVFDPKTAAALLRSPLVAPTSVPLFYEAVSGLSRRDFPTLFEAFARSPLPLHGSAHREARSQLTPLYHRVEEGLDEWLDDFCTDYLSELRLGRSPDLVEAASDFSDRVGRAMASNEVSIDWRELPSLPNDIFMLFPSAKRLLALEARFAAIRDVLTRRMRELGRSEEELWPMLTLLLANRDAVQGTLMHMFSHLRDGAAAGSATECAAAAANFSLLQRQVVQDCEIAGQQWFAGDLLQFSPHLLHLREPPPVGTDFTFGAGPHMCQGRRLALRILDALIGALRREPLPAGFFTRIPKLHRQIVLTAEK